MDKKRKIIIFAIIVIVIVIIILSVMYFFNHQGTTGESDTTNTEYLEVPNVEIDKNQIDYNPNATVDELKEYTGASGDSELYEVSTEYDGRKVLKIKDNIMYDVALAGILKQGKPEFAEIDTLKRQAPSKTGIWISENSRTNFLNLLQEQTKTEYSINDEGYLEIKNKNSQNDIDKKLEDLISNNEKQFIIDMSGIDYTIDTVTGEIVEYPFEEIDAYQVFDYIANGNNNIIVVTTNTQKALTNNEILSSIIEQMENI